MGRIDGNRPGPMARLIRNLTMPATMTARRVSRKPSTPIHFDAYGNPLRRVNVSDADRTEAAVLLNPDAVSPAPVKPAIVKTARKPIFEYRRITDEYYSPTENSWGYKSNLEYDFGLTEAATVD
jgi:hypothetical protein